MTASQRPKRHLLLAVPGALLMLLACAPVSNAATATAAAPYLFSQTISYAADPGESNDVTVTRSGDVITFTDPGVTITAGSIDCVGGVGTAVCTGWAGAKAVVVDTDDGDDTITNAMAAGTVKALLYDGCGNDTVVGGPTDDTEYQEGNCGGQADADDLTALDSGGVDTVSYVGHSEGVNVSVDGTANDGASGEGDDVGDIETLIGSELDDTLKGGTGPNVLAGCTGDDVIDGGAGNDSLYDIGVYICFGGGNDLYIGGPGDDNLGAGAVASGFDEGGIDTVSYADHANPVTATLDGVANDGSPADSEADNIDPFIENVIGGDGADSITGNSAANVISGGPDADSLYGGPGNDTLSGQGGDDPAIEGGDDDDLLSGGPGNDSIGGSGAGENGTDTATYGDHTAAVTADLDGIAGDDGSPSLGEQDTISFAVENLIGGDGNDSLAGNGSNNVMTGGAGDDALDGLAGTDSLVGSGGNDTLVGGPGADAIGGSGPSEEGIDTADYQGRATPVKADADGAADDGASGEGDNIDPAVENLTGGLAGDTLIGTSSANVLIGGSGDDALAGGGGADSLQGDDGDDQLEGEQGNDTLHGGADADIVSGGAGSDDAYGEDGADELRLRDSENDTGSCGDGDDRANADGGDAIAGDCETLYRDGNLVVPSTPPASPPKGSLSMNLPKQLTIGYDWKLAFGFDNSGGATCTGKLSLVGRVRSKRKHKRVSKQIDFGSSPVAIEAGKKDKTIVFTVNRKGRKALKRYGRANVNVSLDCSAPDGTRFDQSKTVLMRRAGLAKRKR